MNHLLSGKAPSCLAPWLHGVPLIALHKRVGGVCPRSPASFDKSSLLSCCSPFSCVFFALYGQVGICIPGGLEGTINVTHHFISVHGSLVLLKMDIKNAMIILLFYSHFWRFSWDFCLPFAFFTYNFTAYQCCKSSWPCRVNYLVPWWWQISWGAVFFMSLFATWDLDYIWTLSKCVLFRPSGDSFLIFPADIKQVTNLYGFFTLGWWYNLQWFSSWMDKVKKNFLCLLRSPSAVVKLFTVSLCTVHPETFSFSILS